MRTRCRRLALAALTLTFAWTLAGRPLAGQDLAPRFDLALRANIMGASGKPTNDQLGAGLFGRFHLDERWSIGVAIDHASGFDVERPAEFLGLPADPAAGEIDASGSATQMTAWLERRHARGGSRWEWFWGLGAGATTTDVDTVRGPLVGDGEYEISQEVGTELVAAALGGVRLRMGGAWLLELQLRADHHFTDWRVEDSVSGQGADLDDYLVRGVSIGLGYRF